MTPHQARAVAASLTAVVILWGIYSLACATWKGLGWIYRACRSYQVTHNWLHEIYDLAVGRIDHKLYLEGGALKNWHSCGAEAAKAVALLHEWRAVAQLQLEEYEKNPLAILARALAGLKPSTKEEPKP